METGEKKGPVQIKISAEGDQPEAVEVEAEAGRENGQEEEKDWKAEAEENREMYLRVQADMENMRKRLEREKADFIKFANENLMKDLLPVIDNLERALNHAQADDSEAILQGVQLTYDGFKNVLEKFGVRAVASLGERFDPNFHEAVMQREDPDAEDNTVLEEIQKGYLLNERLIRPSMVVVSKRPHDQGEDS